MILVIDTATAACSIALVDGDRVLAERHEALGRGHAERLMPMIQTLIGSHRPRSILVDCGPGSFTGVRVGLAAAHGLAIGWQIPLFGYSSMAAIGLLARDRRDVAVAVHGGHGQLFVQTYGHQPYEARDELRSLLPEDAAAAIETDLVLGSGAETLVKTRGFGQAQDALPRAADARLLPETLRALPPRPIYGRAPDAKPMQQ